MDLRPDLLRGLATAHDRNPNRLGARQRGLIRVFLTNGFLLALTGISCGLAASAALARMPRSSLFGVSPLDPLIYAAVSSGSIVTAVTNSYIPARHMWE
jgi:hypothetical protein